MLRLPCGDSQYKHEADAPAQVRIFTHKHTVMEPVGVAVGVLGLAGLFSTCLEAVEKLQSYKAFGTDSQDLNTQFKADKLRFEQWGRQVGFDHGNLAANHNQALDNSGTRSLVVELFLIIKRVCDASDDAPQQLALHGTGPGRDGLSSANQAQLFHSAPSKSKRRKFAWALWGKGKRTEQVKLFGTVVQQLHHLIAPDGAKGTSSVHGPNAGGSGVLDSL